MPPTEWQFNLDQICLYILLARLIDAALYFTDHRSDGQNLQRGTSDIRRHFFGS